MVAGIVAMRALIISDLHANLEAVEALPATGFDQIWVLGDLVNYGPDPAAVVDYVRERAAVVVRGNHDHAMGFDEDPRCSPRFRAMAAEMGAFTRSVLGDDQRNFLRDLPLKTTVVADGAAISLCHAVPADPLYEYRPGGSPLWETEETEPEVALEMVGHTHVPFRRPVGNRTVMNPGSVGQPKHGFAEACFAIWQDGRADFASAPYDVERTVSKLRKLPLSRDVFEDLAFVLRNGTCCHSR
jgi:predicted phosphodiesterase